MKPIMQRLEQVVSFERLAQLDIKTAIALRNDDLLSPVWHEAESVAFQVLEIVEDSIFRFEANDIDGIIEKPLTYSGQILWAVAQRKQRLGLQSNATDQITDAIFISLKASVAFLYAGNLANAYAVTRISSIWPTAESAFYLFYEIIETLFHFPGPEANRNVADPAQRLSTYYNDLMAHRGPLTPSQLERDIPDLPDIIAHALDLPSINRLSIPVSSLAYSFQTLLDWLGRHLSVHVLDDYFGNTVNIDEYRTAISIFGPHFLFPSQRQALHRLKNINRDTNIILSFPTSAGKTFVSEVLGLEPLLRGKTGLVVHLVPLRALVTQHRENRTIRDRLQRSGIKFMSIMGGYMEDIPHISSTEKTFAVATVEAFDYAWRNNSLLKDILRNVVIDEFQLIEQENRGVNLECLCGKFLTYQGKGLSRIILLSAVIDETEELRSWLRVPENAVLKTHWSPTQKRITLPSPRREAAFWARPDQIEPDFSPNTILNWPYSSGIERLAGKTEGKLRKDNEQKFQATIAGLTLFVSERLGGSVLVVCGTRADSRRIALQLAEIAERKDLQSLSEKTRGILYELLDILNTKYPFYTSLRYAIERGICYHNAGLPSEVKEKLQALIEEGYFDAVASTTTLAEGVNLPFRTVVMERWMWRNEESFKPLLIRNITGRAGRAGYFVEGDTVFADNLRSSSKMGMHDIIERFYAKQNVKLSSGLSHLDISKFGVSGKLLEGIEIDAYSIPSQIGSISRLQSFLASFLQDEGSRNNPVGDFVSNLYISHENPNLAARITTYLEEFIKYELSFTDFPLVQSNSPVSLTALGREASATGLSLSSARQVFHQLEKIEKAEAPKVHHGILRKHNHLLWDGWLESVFRSLLNTNEIQVGYLGTTQRYGSVVKPDNVDLVLWGWSSGWSIPSILWLIRYRQKKQQEKWQWPFETSRQGLEIEGEVLELQRFCEDWFSHSWNWVLTASARLAEAVNASEELPRMLRQLAEKMKYGVAAPLAVEIVKSRRRSLEFPGNREHAQIVAHWANQKGYSEYSLLDLWFEGQYPTRDELREIVLDDQAGKLSHISEEMAIRICDWFEQIDPEWLTD